MLGRTGLLSRAGALLLSGIIAVFPLLSIVPQTQKVEAATALAPHVFKEQVTSSTFYLPTDFTIAPDGRIFVAEKNGEIRVVKNGAVLPQPSTCSPPSQSNSTSCPVTIAADVYGERGLLGITLDSNFATDHYVYVIYVNSSPLEYHVSRFTEANDQAVAGSELVLFRTGVNPNAATHFGGGLRIDGDKLFFTIGENLNSTDAQDLSTYYGKLMRINTNGTLPSDNPFVGQSGKKPEIWAYGLRNPYKISIGPNHQVIAGDVGGDVAEEINVIQKGADYGWPVCEGPCSPVNSQMTDPTYSYLHGPTASTSGAVTAGFVYTGTQFPASYQNKYFFGDYVRGYIHSIDLANVSAGETPVDNTAGAVVSLQQAPDGSIYFIDIYPAGTLYHVYYSLNNQPPTANIAADKTFGPAPLTVQFSSVGSSDPDNNTINYKWDFGDGATSTDPNPTHTYSAKGQYVAKLVVNDGLLDSQPVSVNIAPGYAPPSVTIINPALNTKYNAGDVIAYSATATDPQDGALPPSAYSWTMRLHHLDHYHPFLGPITGVTQGTFTIPNNVENSPFVSYDITLTVTDSNNLTTTTTRTVTPNLSSFTVQSSPVANLVADVDGIPYATPYTQSTTVGYKIDLKAESPVTRDGTTYQFTNWSDGVTSPERVVTIPSTNTTYTAQYQPTIYAMNPNDAKQLPANSVISGDITVNGTPLYDNDSTTGLVTLLDQSASVSAQWGAVIYTNPSPSAGKTTQQQVASQVKATGCGGNGCTSVTSIEWPTVTPTPTGTPAPLPSPRPDGSEYQIAANQTLHVTTHTVISGDISVNGTPLYDSDGNTGLVTTFSQGADVTAPWGARAKANTDATSATQTAQTYTADLKAHGCGGTCTSVTNISWPTSGTPTPPPTNTQFTIGAGQTMHVPANTVVSGDIKAENTVLYDNDGKTGLVTRFTIDADVTAPWGATGITTTDGASAQALADNQTAAMKANGCGSSCTSVQEITYPQTPAPLPSPRPTAPVTGIPNPLPAPRSAIQIASPSATPAPDAVHVSSQATLSGIKYFGYVMPTLSTMTTSITDTIQTLGNSNMLIVPMNLISDADTARLIDTLSWAKTQKIQVMLRLTDKTDLTALSSTITPFKDTVYGVVVPNTTTEAQVETMKKALATRVIQAVSASDVTKQLILLPSADDIIVTIQKDTAADTLTALMTTLGKQAQTQRLWAILPGETSGTTITALDTAAKSQNRINGIIIDGSDTTSPCPVFSTLSSSNACYNDQTTMTQMKIGREIIGNPNPLPTRQPLPMPTLPIASPSAIEASSEAKITPTASLPTPQASGSATPLPAAIPVPRPIVSELPAEQPTASASANSK